MLSVAIIQVPLLSPSWIYFPLSLSKGNNQMNLEEWRYFLSGPSGEIQIKENPTKWVDDNSWLDMYRQIYGIGQLPNFNGFTDFFISNCDLFKGMFDSQHPHLDPLPEPWESKLSELQKMIVLKAIRSDKVTRELSST